MAVIELDLYAAAGPERRPGVPAHRYRYAGLAVVLGLLLTLGGAAPASAVLWRETGQAPLANTGSFELIDGRLYTFAGAGTLLTTTAWSMDPVRRLWRTTDRVPASADDTDLTAAGFDVAATPAGPADILLQVGDTSMVIDARTGAHRWRVNASVTPLAGRRVGLIYDSVYAPGTVYRNGRPGTVYSGDGTLDADPPVRTTVHGVDLRTGRELWSLRHDALLAADEIAGEPGTTLMVAPDWLALVATGTGRVLRERHITDPQARDFAGTGAIVGDLVLLRHGRPGPGGTLTAYSRRTLQPLWHRPDSAGGDDQFLCLAVACAVGGGRLDVLDPASGRSRWQIGGSAILIGRGPDVVESAEVSGRPERVRDRATGEVRADLRRWSWYSWGQDDGPLILGRPEPAGGTVFAVYRPDRRAVQPLGRSGDPVSGCRSDDHHVVCHTLHGVTTWAYP